MDHADEAASFTVRVRVEMSAVTVVLAGEIDIAAAPVVVAAVDAAAEHDLVIVVDLAGVSFIDSTGVKALLECRRTHGSNFVIGSRSDRVDRVFELTGVASLLALYGGETEPV